VGLVPGSLSLDLGMAGSQVVADVDMSDGSPPDGHINRIEFSSSDAGVASVKPSQNNFPPASYSTMVTGEGVGPAEISVVVRLVYGTTCSDPTPVQVTVNPPGPWFQTQGGDVHAEGRISSKIFPLNTYFSDADPGDYPGLISYNYDEQPNFGRGSVSEKGWLAEDGFSVNYSFDRFYSKLGSPNEDDLGTDTLKDYVTDYSGQSVFYLNNDIKISNKWDFPANRKAIVLINGKLTIDKEIIVPVGSFLAFIVKNDIEIKGVIGAKPDQFATAAEFINRDPDIEGVYITDNVLKTNYDDDNSGNQLKVAGIFIANSFELDHDLKIVSGWNELYPSEIFIARPDLFVNIPEELKESYFFEQEVAP